VELADVISEIPGIEVMAFVENLERNRCQEPLEGLPVLWVDELAEQAGQVQAICGLATTQRWQYVEQVRALGVTFATLRHPTARVSRTAELGDGCFISPFANVSTRTVLGAQVFLNRGVLVGHHTRIGDYCTVQPGANIAGSVTIGERTYIGMGAIVRDNVTIGAGCVIGAGAVVTKDLPDHVLALGLPASIVQTGIEGK
jgi:sugar O-acyltransferase (sialic acid O-acetyltransferase NeuD family)